MGRQFCLAGLTSAAGVSERAEFRFPFLQPFLFGPDRFPVPFVLGRRWVQHRIDHVVEATVQVVLLCHVFPPQGYRLTGRLYPENPYCTSIVQNGTLAGPRWNNLVVLG